jgi:hypothetical protein
LAVTGCDIISLAPEGVVLSVLIFITAGVTTVQWSTRLRVRAVDVACKIWLRKLMAIITTIIAALARRCDFGLAAQCIINGRGGSTGSWW